MVFVVEEYCHFIASTNIIERSYLDRKFTSAHCFGGSQSMFG